MSEEREWRDKQEIHELIQNWVLWRDGGDWERFKSLWHDEGRMHATWFQGAAKDFIEANRQGWRKGVRIFHTLGGTSIQLHGDRAIAQTKAIVSQRAYVDGVECDVLCTCRFYDFLERRSQRWGIVLRQGVYDKDRLDPVAPDATLHLDRELLNSFPEGYRYLAYLQTRIGYTVKKDMPQSEGPELEELYRSGALWLQGGPSPIVTRQEQPANTY
jgi:hypothetical protein